MKATYKYKDINQTMRGIRRQVLDSLPYTNKRFSGYRTPEQLYENLKQLVVYVNDPDGVELLQTAETLFENNEHGIPGAGDCDCFTILTTACCITNGFPVDIVLVGNSKAAPSHIYNRIRPGDKPRIFDLTETFIGMERPYKWRQFLPVKY